MKLRRPAARILALCLATLTACGGSRKMASPSASRAYDAMAAAPGGGMAGDAKIASEAGETWKRSTIVPNSSRVMVGDREQLTLKSMQTKVTIDGFRARVVIDYLYANEHARQLEGTFQLRLPEEASPYFFAFGETSFGAREAIQPTMTIATSGDDDPRQLMVQRQGAWTGPKEARIVPRETAQMAYEQTVRRRVDPAIVEWAGAGVFSARVFPLAPNKLHRIVVGYDVDLVKIGDDLEYRFDLPKDAPSSVVDISVPDGTGAVTTPRSAPQATPGRQVYRFTGTQDRTIAARIPNAGSPVLVGNDPAGSFFAARTVPALPSTAGQTAADAVFLVDTSLSSNPDRFNIWLKLLRATLDANRDSLKRFNVVFFSVDAHWYKPGLIENTAANVDELMTFANGLALEGATDLGAALASASSAGNANSKHFDLFLLSDGAATWGESNLHALGRTLRATGASLFAYQTGLAGTDVATLGHLARESGGAVFSVTGEAEIARAATAHRARPWRLLEARVTGASDVMLAGRPMSLFPGQTVIATGRGAIAAGAELSLLVEQNGKRETIKTKLAQPLASPLAARTYGQIATNRLEELGAATAPVSKAYATHFRITGQTCSLLMLESEADYQRFNIKPEADVELVKTVHAAQVFDRALEQTYSTLGDPKAAFLDMLRRLERLPNTRLQIPVAYRAAIERMPAEAFAVPSLPLPTQLRGKRQLAAPVLGRLAKHDVDYDALTADSTSRRRTSPADALKSLSSLVEHSPGDAVLARDVGYSAMELGLRAQAYHLFRRVADARPHEPQTYRAIAQALAALGKHELALAYYEIPLMGNWDARFGDLRKIVELDYMHFLRGIKASAGVREYAQARLQSLSKAINLPRADVVVTITWNTDNTDVDLHVVEPSGEECYYAHRNTKSGGSLTQDVTQGYGPEMYVLPKAPRGKFNVFAHYFAQDRNRTSARTKVYVTMFENWGTEHERITERVVMLEMGKQRHPIAMLEFKGITVAR